MSKVGNNYNYVTGGQVSLKPKPEKDTTKEQIYQSALLVMA